MITQEEVKNLLEYCEGKLFWKTRGYGNAPIKAGSIAGSICSRGYIRIKLKNKNYLAHRLIFLIHHGYMPDFVDHVDGDKSNNNIENLREANRATNGWNRKPYANNKTGIKNIKLSKNSKSWLVNINVNKQRIYCGSFDDLELADLVAQEARDLYHGRFARHV